jgi:hypothetical protein
VTEQANMNLDRRRFLEQIGRGAKGCLGLAALSATGLDLSSHLQDELVLPHFKPKAKRVIYLHMMGAPSQLDLFDYKPKLEEMKGKDLRKLPNIYNGQRITGMTSEQASLPLVPSMFKFKKYDNDMDGAWVSELYPHTAGIVKKLCFVNSMHTEAINHEPGVTFMQTGSQIPGRPSIGSWLSYGLGRANPNLPAFVVMISQGYGNMQALSTRLWGSGFLPSEHQGVRFRSGANPVLFLDNPSGLTRKDRRRMVDAVAKLNGIELERSGDQEIAARVAQAEMAYRMQKSVPDLTNFADESEKTLEMYGPEVQKPGTFANNCLLARRLAERDVRFIQLYHRGWDGHGNLPKEIRQQCRQTDQPQAALIKDLEQRGLLDDTLVVWGGEFGRTAYCQGKFNETTYGRDHHPRCFTMWFAGGGIRPGITHGSSDDYGYNVATDGVHVHDMHATMLHLLGIDHKRLTYRYQGRRFRLTDVAGNVVKKILV